MNERVPVMGPVRDSPACEYSARVRRQTERVYSDTANYRLPVFTIEGEANSDIVLSRLELANNKHNIAYDNNCIRWLRRVESSKPYFSTKAPATELHLCSLYLHPNSYSSFDEVVAQMNRELKETKNALFHEEVDETPSVLVSVYKGEFAEGRKLDISNASFSSFEAARLESVDVSNLEPIYEQLVNAISLASRYNTVDAFNYVQFARPDIYFFNTDSELNQFSTFMSYMSNAEPKLSSIVSSVSNVYTPYYNKSVPYSRNGAFYAKIDSIQAAVVSTRKNNAFFDNVINEFSEYIELNYSSNIVTQLANVYLSNQYSELGLALVNIFVNMLCEYDEEPKIREEFAGKTKYEIVTNENVNAIVTLAESLGIFEINNETIFYMTNLNYMISFPDYPPAPSVEYLHQLEAISKRWFTRYVNEFIVSAILAKKDPAEELTILITHIRDALTEFAASHAAYDEINVMTNAWTSISKPLNELLSEFDVSVVVANIVSSITTKLEKISADIEAIRELYVKALINVTPAYEFTLDRTYIALIDDVSLINNVSIIDISINNAELLKYNDDDIELEKSQGTISGYYTASNAMLHRYTDSYADSSWPSIESFRTKQAIVATIYYFENDEWRAANFSSIPCGTLLTAANIEDVSTDKLYAKSGLIESARIDNSELTVADLATFHEELVERPLDSTNTYITNSALLEDAYFAKMYNEDEPFVIVNDSLGFKLSAIAVVASSDRLGEGSSYNVSFMNANALYVKDIMTYDDNAGLRKTSNQYILSKYNDMSLRVNDEYYATRQSANGLAERLGLMTVAIEETAAPYIIKTHNYSEQVYAGPITLLTNLRISGQAIPLPKGLTMNAQTYDIAVGYLFNRNIIRIAEPSLIIPSQISIFESNNEDIEMIINRGELTNEVYSFDAELKVVEFSSDIKLTIPATGKLFIYISSDEQSYVYGNGRYVLYFDRV